MPITQSLQTKVLRVCQIKDLLCKLKFCPAVAQAIYEHQKEHDKIWNGSLKYHASNTSASYVEMIDEFQRKPREERGDLPPSEREWKDRAKIINRINHRDALKVSVRAAQIALPECTKYISDFSRFLTDLESIDLRSHGLSADPMIEHMRSRVDQLKDNLGRLSKMAAGDETHATPPRAFLSVINSIIQENAAQGDSESQIEAVAQSASKKEESAGPLEVLAPI